jgi:hypothetical protein
VISVEFVQRLRGYIRRANGSFDLVLRFRVGSLEFGGGGSAGRRSWALAMRPW